MKQKLTKEQLKMQKIAGIITENEYRKQLLKEDYTEPQIPAEPLFLDLEKEGVGKGLLNQAINDAIQAQKFLKRLFNTRLDPKRQKMLTKGYLEKMKLEGLLYPGIFTENQTGKKTLNEGELLNAIVPKPSGEFKDAVIALENYLATTGGTFDYKELAYLIIDIKNADRNDDIYRDDY